MRRRRNAFTMIELMMVVTIMGIIAALILKAASNGIRRAEEKATIGLIAKLEAALTDRMDALQNEHPEPTGIMVPDQSKPGSFVVSQHGHASLAAVYNLNGYVIPNAARAQLLAYYDNLRAELPDVFIVQNASPTAAPGIYPLNFAGAPFPAMGPLLQNNMPLGADGANFPVTGMYGASFGAAAGIYQQLGYAPAGYDGNDNDGNNTIDDMAEAVIGLTPAQQTATITQIHQRLKNHTHKTARAEMLYAVLCYGTGPMGSSFNPDDFAKNEVADTDGDGLMEFVDAWGEPLQFYRWPIMYNSDTQRGFPPLTQIAYCQNNSAPIGPYSSIYDAREVNTLDPNQLLLAPAWWTRQYNSQAEANLFFAADATSNASAGAIAFQNFFHTLIDPLAAQTGTSGLSSSNTGVNTYWDRSAPGIVNSSYGKIYGRRAYYNRFLVLSAGPDKIPGTAQLGVNYGAYSTAGGIDERDTFPLPSGNSVSGNASRDATGAPVGISYQNVIQIENQAGRIDPNRSGLYMGPTLTSGRNDTNTFLEDVGNDDITSQNIRALGGPLQ